MTELKDFPQSQGQLQPQQPESVILIRFASPNSTLVEIKYQNVSPLQSIAAAWVLQQEAQMALESQTEARKQQDQLGKIAVPGIGQGRGM